MKVLTDENANEVKEIRNITHPEWGVWTLKHNAQQLNDDEYCDVIVGRSGSKLLAQHEYKYWEVIS